MILKKQKLGKIFITYRRSDTQGYAGRLSDSLENYFGGNRIFRDIDDIIGGSEFAKDIENQMSSADAVIILIGPTWLSVSNDDGSRRIDNPEDWVAQEIVSAIELGIPLFPVLIEGTSLPRKDELPEKLAPILNYNAITISDRNWDADVLGLGKIISFDIPTKNEKTLFRLQVLIYTLLSASLIFSAGTIAYSAYSQPETSILIPRPIAGIPFYVVVVSLIILSLIVRQIAKEKQKYMVYSLISGSVLTAFFFFGWVVINNIINKKLNDGLAEGITESFLRMNESMFIFFGSVLTVTLMFIFLGLSGFKPK